MGIGHYEASQENELHQQTASNRLPIKHTVCNSVQSLNRKIFMHLL